MIFVLYGFSCIMEIYIAKNIIMKVRSTAEVRKHFQEVVDHVHYTKIPVIITKNRKPWVMVQPLPEDDKELQALVNDSKEN